MRGVVYNECPGLLSNIDMNLMSLVCNVLMHCDDHTSNPGRALNDLANPKRQFHCSIWKAGDFLRFG